MSFFNSIPQIMLLNQKIAEVDAKLNSLTNFDYETMTMGNYKLQNNKETDTLDIEYKNE